MHRSVGKPLDPRGEECLPDYQVEYFKELFGKLNEGLLCPPFEGSNLSLDCVS